MQQPELRYELERVYDAVRDALVAGDLTAYLATGADPDLVVDASNLETARNEFPESARMLLAFGYPARSEVEFVDARAADDFAAYYFRFPDRDDPELVRLCLVRFKRIEGDWAPAGEDYDETIRAASQAELESEIAEQIERSPEFTVFRPPPLRPISGPPEGTDLDLGAVVGVFGHGYELSVFVNGVDSEILGGGSSSMRLLGAADGANPGHPYILRRGTNQLRIRYRRTVSGSPHPLSVSLRVAEQMPSVYLVATRKGPREFTAEFEVPVDGPEEVVPVFHWDGEAGPGVFVHVATEDFAVESSLNGEAGPSLVGMSDTLAIPGPRAGSNELVVRARALSPPAVFRAAVVTPIGVRWLERTANSTEEWSDTVVFAHGRS